MTKRIYVVALRKFPDGFIGMYRNNPRTKHPKWFDVREKARDVFAMKLIAGEVTKDGFTKWLKVDKDFNLV